MGPGMRSFLAYMYKYNYFVNDLFIVPNNRTNWFGNEWQEVKINKNRYHNSSSSSKVCDACSALASALMTFSWLKFSCVNLFEFVLQLKRIIVQLHLLKYRSLCVHCARYRNLCTAPAAAPPSSCTLFVSLRHGHFFQASEQWSRMVIWSLVNRE